MFVALACVASETRAQSPTSGSMIVFDAHQDCLLRILDKDHDLGSTYGKEQGNIDMWKKGGFNAIFFSVWVDPRAYAGEEAVTRAHRLIEAFRAQTQKHADVLQPCDTAIDVRNAIGRGKIACLLGLEGGVAINDDLRMIPRYRQLGVRYMTLTWRGNLAWAGSSQSDDPQKGLTDFGRQVVRELNNVGIVVDLSHVSDRTFYDALQTTTKPVIVSHSNARLLSASPRNVTDDMLRALAKNGGVIGVNFSGDFLRTRADGIRELRPGPPDIKTVADQIDHICEVAGIEHVGFGTDYDGGIRPARGLENAALLPALLSELHDRGYSTDGIRLICGENFARVLQANDAAPTSQRPAGGQQLQRNPPTLLKTSSGEKTSPPRL